MNTFEKAQETLMHELRLMTFSPTVPRPSASVARQASSSKERLMPKLALAFSVPAMD